MITPVVQRWRSGRDSYRPAGEPIRTRDYDVAEIPDDRTAKAFVVEHHYSRSFPAARFRFGLYGPGGALEGVAVFSHPCRAATLTRVFGAGRAAVDLGRFVLLDQVPANGESWLLARCFEVLRREHGIEGVTSFSDPLARENLHTGELVTPGHVGTIYQASNGVYLGRSKAEALRLLPGGTSLPRRSIAKVLAGDRGWRHVVARLVREGARSPACLPAGAADVLELRAWLAAWLPQLTRVVRHPGNHKYAWPLDKRLRREMPEGLAYPKRVAAA